MFLLLLLPRLAALRGACANADKKCAKDSSLVIMVLLSATGNVNCRIFITVLLLSVFFTFILAC